MIPEWLEVLPLDVICTAAKKHDISWDLLAAVAFRESRGRMDAMRYEAHFEWLVNTKKNAKLHHITQATEENVQRISVGYCQIMFAVMRELGYQGSFLNAFRPKINFYYGAKKLRALTKRFGFEDDVISAYNQGGPYRNGAGEFKNRINYVDPIKILLTEIRDPIC